MIRWGIAALVAFAFYLVALVVTRVVYRRAIFQRPRAPVPPVPEGARLRTIRAADGMAVTTLHFDAPPHAPTLVYFHGAGVTLHDIAPIGLELRRRGLGVMLVEYRGYGSSPGTPSEEALYLDGHAVLDALEADGVTADRTILFGISLGSAVAAELAARGRGARLVLATPFTSMPDLVANYAPFAPTSLVVRERFDTRAKLAELAIPTLVVHGDQDSIIPHAMGAALAKEAPTGRLVTVLGGHHTDLFELHAATVYDAIVEHARLSELLRPRSPSSIPP